MKVTCERCGTEYNFDDANVTEAGVKVKCTRCEHVFRVRKKQFVVTEPASGPAIAAPSPSPSPAPSPAPEPAAATEPSNPGLPREGSSRKWVIRKFDGSQLEFNEMTTLQRWIVERRVGPEDEISHNGVKWKRLGTIPELGPFFDIVSNAPPGSDETAPKPAAPTQVALAPTPGPSTADASPTATAVAANSATPAASAAPSLAPSATPAVSSTPAATPTKSRAPSVDQLLTQGYELYSKGKYREAIRKYQAAVDADQSNSEAWALLGLAYLDDGQDELSESCLQTSIRLNPRFADSHRYLGLLYSKRDDKARAITEFNTYLDLRPTGPTSDDVRKRVASLGGG